MTGSNMPPGTNPPHIPHGGEDDAFFEMVWNKLAGRIPLGLWELLAGQASVAGSRPKRTPFSATL
jgi:hypothetical protein